MITKSLNKIAYITYKTGSIGDIIEDNKGMYLFQILDTEEIEKVIDEYNRCVDLQDKMCVDLVKYNRIIHIYKNKVKAYKMMKVREEHLNKIDKTCDMIVNNLKN